MRDLLAAGLPLAMVIGGIGAQDRDGIEVLAAIRAIDAAAVRVATVRWGDRESARSIFNAVTLGKIDHRATRPVQVPAEEFHRSITEFPREWSSRRDGGYEAVRLIGEPWSARSQELRDIFARYRVPAGFTTSPPNARSRCCASSAWSCRWSYSGSGRAVTSP